MREADAPVIPGSESGGTGDVSLLQDGLESLSESIGETYRGIDREIKKRRKAVEKRTRKQLNGVRKRLPKGAQHLQREGTRWIEKRVAGALAFLQLASKKDLARIERKLTQIDRTLDALDPGKKRG